ncbi:MAG TPA: sulfurtransferase [Thermoguttaceae bacterium]|nr:sulfurtransferase [Thermoguttaceae bacterium]
MRQTAHRSVAKSLVRIAAVVLLAGCTSESALKAPQITAPPTPEAFALLITPQVLADRLTDETLRIVDVRPKAEYDEGHIPGAVHLDIDAWKTLGLSDGGLQDAAAWATNVRALGIDMNTSVVVYGGPLNDAARAWWLLKYVGLPDVRLLDGDWTMWKAADRPIETEAVETVATDFQPNFQADRLAETDDVRRYGDDPDVVILDARGTLEYLAGHVPSAVHLDWSNLLADDGRFLSPEQLRAVFEEVPLERTKTVVTYCKSGSRSSAEAFALELAGYEKVKNYFGSWKHWSAKAQ